MLNKPPTGVTVPMPRPLGFGRPGNRSGNPPATPLVARLPDFPPFEREPTKTQKIKFRITVNIISSIFCRI